jgi:hypothetical protein
MWDFDKLPLDVFINAYIKFMHIYSLYSFCRHEVWLEEGGGSSIWCKDSRSSQRPNKEWQCYINLLGRALWHKSFCTIKMYGKGEAQFRSPEKMWDAVLQLKRCCLVISTLPKCCFVRYGDFDRHKKYCRGVACSKSCQRFSWGY